MVAGSARPRCASCRSGLNTLLALDVGLGFDVAGLGLTVLDLIGLAIAGVMLAALLGRARHNVKRLAELEPAA